MADSSSEPRAKRARVDKASRFEKLRQLKGKKNKCEVEEAVNDVYEILDEREYIKKAKEKYGGNWIEEDGTGYAEDGRDFFEDDGEAYSDDDDDDKAQTSNKKPQQKGSKKRPRDGEKPAKAKGSIRNLFSNAMQKKPAMVSLAEDNILADILGELHEDKTTDDDHDAIAKPQVEKVIMPAKIVAASKRTEAALATQYMNTFKNNLKLKEPTEPLTAKQSEDDALINSILKAKSTEAQKTQQHKKTVIREPAKQDTQPEVTVATEADMDFSCLNNQENEFVEELTKSPTPIAAKIVEKPAAVVAAETAEMDLQQLLCNWENICQIDNLPEEPATTDASGGKEAAGETGEVLKFWYWEAWEDAYKQPGQIFLFGRTEAGKSIAVRVENVERVLYLLPREYKLDAITKEPTKEKVTLADIYKEFDEDIAVQLKLDGFRSRKVTKNFAHHGIGLDVPQSCDYMQVLYDGRKPEPNTLKKYNSIAHIFGSNSGALERFLLERKIKGPGWLTITNYRVNTAPLSWCKLDVTVPAAHCIQPVDDVKPAAPPSLTQLTLRVRTILNVTTLKNEICMIALLVHDGHRVDRPAPQPPFNRHLCGMTRPAGRPWPFDLAVQMAQHQATTTRLHKHDTERALLSWFLALYQQIDADVLVTHDALDCQLDVLCDRIVALKIPQWSRLGRLRLVQHQGKRLLDFYPGRMVCDVRRSAEECIRARSYDLPTLCQQVLKLDAVDVGADELLAMYETGVGVLRLISLTMQNAAYILRLMGELNVLPLALQITSICGNTMTRTLQGGRSERNEFLLLHAFSERNYIVPDKRRRQLGDGGNATAAGRKKAAYAGGLVLDPVRGLYDQYILLMDFNSLYPSIIQEYNICFTTVPQPYSSDVLPPLPDAGVEAGILPQQLRRLVESRREVKKLLAHGGADLAPELQLQYHIRQMALKLTANSMYGCLGFAQSRFFAQHLAALVTQKGREILLNTQALVQRLNYEVVYGDTDSIMVNTHSTDYDQVQRIGLTIKLAVNKLYKQLELDIDGVFSVLLLLKKKKYAAVKLSRSAGGQLLRTQEHKGLDIVRRDWSQLAVKVGREVLDAVLADNRQLDEKLDTVFEHLERVRAELSAGTVALPMYVITKQLSKAPSEFNAALAQSHVQVALRMNATHRRRYKKGDMVEYVICTDGSNQPAVQRAYHLDELKGSETLQLDTQYYLAHQIHPVVTRMLEVLPGSDASRIAECLGLDSSKYRAAAQRQEERSLESTAASAGEALIKTTLQKYRHCDKFKFICVACKTENVVASAFRPAATNTSSAAGGYEPVLQHCSNASASGCSTAPHQYVIAIRNQLVLRMRAHIQRFYQNWLVCDDPGCNYNTRSSGHVLNTQGRPVCVQCKGGALLRQYSERDLYMQLCYYQYIFDLSQQQNKVAISPEVEAAYQMLRLTVEQQLERSAYCNISMSKLFAHLKPLRLGGEKTSASQTADTTTSNVAAMLADE